MYWSSLTDVRERLEWPETDREKRKSFSPHPPVCLSASATMNACKRNHQKQADETAAPRNRFPHSPSSWGPFNLGNLFLRFPTAFSFSARRETRPFRSVFLPQKRREKCLFFLLKKIVLPWHLCCGTSFRFFLFFSSSFCFFFQVFFGICWKCFVVFQSFISGFPLASGAEKSEKKYPSFKRKWQSCFFPKKKIF